MALIGLVNLAERLFNQTEGNSNQDGALTNKSAKAAATPATEQKASDEFRPSSGNAANEAGLFQVNQASVFTAAAALLVQSGDAARAANNTTASNPLTATATNAPADGTSNTTAAGMALAAPTSGATSGATQIQSGIQSLNAALTALGLSADEIAAIDRVAQLIMDFSPAAFTSLVSQLTALAQNAAQPATATSGGATGGTTGGFSIQELSIKFAGVNETLQQGSGNGGMIQISAFQIQVSEINLTLNNSTTGQTAQITAPPPAAASTTTAATLPLTKSAVA